MRQISRILVFQLCLLVLSSHGWTEILQRPAYVQGITQTEARIIWFTKKISDSALRYRLMSEPNNWLEIKDDSGKTRHEVTLTNLIADSTYCYEVLGSSSGCVPFRTAPPNDSPKEVRFAVIGDSGFGNKEQKQIADLLYSWKPDAVLHVGDIVYPDGEFKHYDPTFFEPYAALLPSVPFYPAVGNHDAARIGTFLHFFSPPRNHLAAFSKRFYNFQFGPVHFIVLDSNVPLAPGSPQAEWLQQTLNSPAAKESIWRVAFFHHPPYSAAKRGNRPQLIQELLPVLESSNVQLVLSGHDHCYQRLEPPPVTQGHQSKITYLVSGGGGASLSKQAAQPEYLKAYGATYHYLELTADQSRLGITARTVDGTSIDQFFITQAPAQN
jgi:hypothetical protein